MKHTLRENGKGIDMLTYGFQLEHEEIYKVDRNDQWVHTTRREAELINAKLGRECVGCFVFKKC